MSIPQIQVATEAQRSDVLSVATAAFIADPLMRWMLPSAATYLSHYPAFVQAVGGASIDQGSCYVTDGLEGAAMWLPPGMRGDEDALAQLLPQIMPNERLAALVDAFTQCDNYHPHADNCWYLSVIGVDPGHQGKGVGAALMKEATRKLDEMGCQAFLESSNPQNISLYQRHGFEIMGEVRVGDMPVLTPMLRPAAG